MDAYDVFYEEVVKRAGSAGVLVRAGKAVRNFAKRQAHGLTGAYASEAAQIGLNPANVQAGVTSLPGIAKGLVRRPKETIKAVGREAMSGGRTGLALGVGLPVAFAAPDLAHGDESAQGGRSMRQKLVNVGSGVVGGALTAGVPVLPQMIGSTGVDVVSNKLLGGRKRPARIQTQEGL